mgnify:CR=1 FL=1
MRDVLCPLGTHDFNQNRQCRYFPCHPGADTASFNCKHCYCPLYFIYWTDCGGDFQILGNGVKDCTACLLPHQPQGHDFILEKLREYFALVKPVGGR